MKQNIELFMNKMNNTKTISIPLFLALLLMCSLSTKSAKGVIVVIFDIFFVNSML